MKDLIKIHEIKGYISSLYLFQRNDELVLLDSGCRCDTPEVESFIQNKLDLSMSSLRVVITTHAHPDHSGGASYYQRKFNSKIAGPVDLNSWYAGFNGFFTYLIDIFLTLYVAHKMKRPIKNIIFSRALKLDYGLKDNDPIPGFPELKAIKAPGHTTCDISILCEELGVAYIADNVISLRKKFIRPYPLFSPEEYKNTLKKYKTLKIQKYLLAHSGAREISDNTLDMLADSIPENPRVHKTALAGILFKTLRKKN